jgi:hypothetical protein
MKLPFLSLSAIVLLATNSPSGCTHAPEATQTENVAAEQAVAVDGEDVPATVATDGEAPGDPAVDKMLDAYDAWMQENMKLMERAMDGDMAATMDMSGTIEKGQTLHQQLVGSTATVTLSKAQQARLDAMEAKYEAKSEAMARRGVKMPLIMTEEQGEKMADRANQHAEKTQKAMQGVEQQMQEMEKQMQGDGEAVTEEE